MHKKVNPVLVPSRCLTLPRLLAVTIELVQHNEKNSCHEVITMARSSVAVGKATGLREKSRASRVLDGS